MNAISSDLKATTWGRPPDSIALGRDEVHLWRATLDRTPSQSQRFLDSLAQDERARAERFHFERDRTHFIVARGILRAILGGYLKRAPKHLSFRYGTHGKPEIADQADEDAINFNMSHSHGMALYAVTRGRAVGVDLERIRSNLAFAEIADRFFAPHESEMLRAFPIDEQHQAFFRLWTRKEAHIKARGEGLSLRLDQVDVSSAGWATNTSRGVRWPVRDIAAAPGYTAALATETGGWRLTCWQWPDAI